MDGQRFDRGYWAENWDRSWRGWEDRQQLVSVALLVLAIIGYGWISSDAGMQRLGLWVAGGYVALQFLVFTPWRMWGDATEAIRGYQDRLRPRLAFCFEPDVPPYLHLFRVQLRGSSDQIIRIWRIGIKNESHAVIKRVRVVVESSEFKPVGQAEGVQASAASPVLIESAINAMGVDTKEGTVNVAPGDRPTAYFDLVQQLMGGDGHRPSEWMSLCYATGHRPNMFARAHWIVGLRVEGGGTFARAKFLIDGTNAAGAIIVRPYAII